MMSFVETKFTGSFSISIGGFAHFSGNDCCIAKAVGRIGFYDVHLLATEPEIIDDRYTGNVRGVPCFQHGKVEKLGDWLKANNVDLEDSCFYSDSHNDLPLLKQVARPVAVDPDDILHQHAVAHDWRIMSLRN